MIELSTCRVLVFDDDEAQREVVSEILELEGAEVLNATTLDEAARLLEREPHVVLMDLHGVDADKFMAVARTRGTPPRVVVVSGDIRVRGHAERLHADGWLAKPYDVEQLLAAVRNVLGARGEAPHHAT